MIELAAKAQRKEVPEHLIDGLVRYLVVGVIPGHFLSAVLCNDLFDACARADEKSAAGLRHIVSFLYNDGVVGCYGSPEHMQAWHEHRGLMGLEAHGYDAVMTTRLHLGASERVREQFADGATKAAEAMRERIARGEGPK
jgi:hypothetical protein